MKTMTAFINSTFVLAFSLCGGTALAFTPATKFDAKIVSKVTYLPSEARFRYEYTLQNASSSEHSLKDLVIRYGSIEESRIEAPRDWSPRPTFDGKPFATWLYEGSSRKPIPPGGSQGGFAYVSPGLPEVQKAHIRSSFESFAKDDLEMMDLMSRGATSLFNNSKVYQTVGAGLPPPSSPQATIAKLIALKHQAFDMGWITSKGIVISLDKKLDAASAAIGRGNTNAARGQLNAFIHEIDAQAGKALTPEAVNLLRPGAQFILSRL